MALTAFPGTESRRCGERLPGGPHLYAGAVRADVHPLQAAALEVKGISTNCTAA